MWEMQMEKLLTLIWPSIGCCSHLSKWTNYGKSLSLLCVGLFQVNHFYFKKKSIQWPRWRHHEIWLYSLLSYPFWFSISSSVEWSFLKQFRKVVDSIFLFMNSQVPSQDSCDCCSTLPQERSTVRHLAMNPCRTIPTESGIWRRSWILLLITQILDVFGNLPPSHSDSLTPIRSFFLTIIQVQIKGKLSEQKLWPESCIRQLENSGTMQCVS